jgi:hypothetical protein
MFTKKQKERTFIITIEEVPNSATNFQYTARVSEKSGYFSWMTYWGETQAEVEEAARAFIERVKRGETHYNITV